MGLQLTVGKGALPGKGLKKYLQRRVEAPILTDKQDRFGLGYKPDKRQKKKELEKKQERRRVRLSGGEVKWEPMTFPHISRTFVSRGTIYPKQKMSGKETVEEMLGNLSINAIFEEGIRKENLSGIFPYIPGNINDMSNIVTNLRSHFEQDMFPEEPQDFEDDRDCNLSPDLLMMVKQDEKQILPYKESIEIVSLREENEMKIGACIIAKTKRDLIELLQEFKDVFA
ncbi:cytochrome P450 CYP749A22-like protein [Gossypium australe]|uniref:Cytochrome P450 CYP749A22-like protein n=1 Tax=Gossypium australe TaxID=47621 RepID=A0A5B6VBX3_9ROSI|nr:cytochrome P450 CYP749A22-like protein [Gossypium australe]